MSKGSRRRRENTALVEANWPTDWNAREQVDEQQEARPTHGQQAVEGDKGAGAE